MNIMELKDVSYKYPLTDEYAIKDLNLEIEEGKFYGVYGKNGHGKTTLGLILRGFIPKIFHGDFHGEYLFKGKDIRDWDLGELCYNLGYVFQNPFTQITTVKDTVFEEICFGLENLGVEREQIIEQVNEVIALFNIESLRDRNPQELSGGQKQKVAIASIMAMKPRIVIFDEPTSQLDPIATKEIFEILNLLKKDGITVILIEHKIEEMVKYCDELICIEDGEVILQGDKMEVLTSLIFEQTGLQLPKFIELTKRLNSLGYQTPKDIYLLEDMVQHINKLLGKEEK